MSQVKVIEIDALWKANFDQYQKDTLKSDEEAIEWAKSLGASEVYKYQATNWVRYIVRADK